MKQIIFIIIIISIPLFAQTETGHWTSQKPDYKILQPAEKDYSLDTSSFGNMALSGFQNTYYFLVSDLDGDNCPFTPTCSHFFVIAVKETNLLKGTLMFADRFTRDLNFIERDKYPRDKNGRLIDLPQKYEMRGN
jgi:putative component of membrane protein insertase Oxa1/YidC/SpoIIIJ protein YidD